MKRTQSQSVPLPEVVFSDHGLVRSLHLGSEWVQGAMWIDRPYQIQLEYVQRMMAGLLFLQLDGLADRHAMQLGLGAGALTKFCRKTLRMRTTAIEINPEVWRACRTWFKLPANDGRLQVLLADAGVEIKDARWQGAVDLLQVDLYDEQAACPVLDDESFYADCRSLLTEDGVMTINLFGRRASFVSSLERIASAFGRQALWSFQPTREGNRVVLAQRRPWRPGPEELTGRAAQVQAVCRLPADKWLRLLRPAFE